MKNYEKPMILANEGLAEGVYAASGSVANISTTPSSHAADCDSQYMNGIWHEPDYTVQTTYGERLGCNGCPAFAENYCQLDDYHFTGYTSYEVDNGNRKPAWEAKGHAYSEAIDWNTYDM
jgi:hypothetical protein